MRAIGHPLLGDPLYAGKRADPVGVARVMLHATRIAFSYPSASEEMVIECPPPADFSSAFVLLDNLTKQS
jgi:23S rRNA pseudouridine1911/1915/1917 synthase